MRSSSPGAVLGASGMKISSTVAVGSLSAIASLALVLWFICLRGEGTQIRRRGRAQAQVALLRTALDELKRDCGTYPNPDLGLGALVASGGQRGWRGPYLMPAVVPRDPWGRPYRYEQTATGVPTVYSVGPDGKPGTRDDVAEVGH